MPVPYYRYWHSTNPIHFLIFELQTGRTHQIRVHMAHIGHPLAGDDLYGGNRISIPRQALHCFELKFFHPFTQEDDVVSRRLPEDMTRLLDGIKDGIPDFITGRIKTKFKILNKIIDEKNSPRWRVFLVNQKMS